MEYYADLEASMEEADICVVERDGCVVLEAKTRCTTLRQQRGVVERIDPEGNVSET
jgi:hypothetical protein